MAGQKHRGLACGIAAADQYDVLTHAQLGLDRRGPVPDAAAFEGVEIFDSRPPVTRPARHHDGFGAQRLPAFGGQRKRAVALRTIQRPDTNRNQHVRAEFLRLGVGAAGERLAGNAARKSQIVFNARAGAGLAAEGPRIEHRDRQSFGRGIDRGGETGGTAADDGHVIKFLMRLVGDHAHRQRQRRLRRIAQHGAVRTDHQRQIGA